MFKRTVSPDDLSRLERERQEATDAYREAILGLEHAIQKLCEAQRPQPPQPYDETQLSTLSELAKPSTGSGWRGALRSWVWFFVGPLFNRQHAFNAALVNHLDRNLAMHRDTLAMHQGIFEELAQIVRVQAKLILYAQSLSPFIETRDFEVSGLMRRINEDVAEVNAGLAATVEGVADELRKRWETTLARERRLETTASITNQVTQTLKREIGRLETNGRRRSAPDTSSEVGHGEEAAMTSSVDSYKYVGFEDAFRGSQEDISVRLESYLPYFEGVTDVLDAGCGRGEFLELLRDHGITAHGIDVNHEMVERCRARDLTVEENDLRSYLRGLPDGALGGLFAAQVVEHLEPGYLLEVLDLAYHKLRPGATVILETINVASWSAFFRSYVRDITHARPLHPDTLQYLVTASGFQHVEVVFRSPLPPEDRLEPMSGIVSSPDDSREINALVVAFNDNIEKLNKVLFGDQDYAVIGRRG